MGQPNYPPPVRDADDDRAVLLTASVTTGWSDWIHGELWLFDDGLLRIPLNIVTTCLHGVGPTVKRKQRRWASFDEHTLASLFATKSCLWLPRAHMSRAYLHRGFITDRLNIYVHNASRVQLLWLPWDGATDVLQATLTAWLGDGLVLD